jgi:pSer/pThr/pTyr-binding forkhead associated (FHA) protein
MKGAGRGRSLPLGYGLHSVGRGEDQRVSLQFGDKGISRRNHVIVSYDDQGRRFYVSPGHGAAIAYLNGQPILQPFPLQAGDRVLVGKTEFVLVPFCGPAFDWQEP